MKAWVHQELADAWGSVIRDRISKHQPRLCCEIQALDMEVALRTVHEEIRSWNRDLVHVQMWGGSTWRSCILDMNQLADEMRKVAPTGEVLSINDMLTLGGCSIDFSKEESGTVELLAVAWGDHESSVVAISKALGTGETFRGN